VKIARVAGTVVSPVCHPFFDGRRLLLCDLLDGDGAAAGYLIAVDVVDAGVGERVLICDEGSSARQIFGVETGPIRSVVVGIVDEVA
jgi:ethanolamine utilization protein EutN